MKIIMSSSGEETKKFKDLDKGAVFTWSKSKNISSYQVYIKIVPVGEYNAFSPEFSDLVIVAEDAECIELDATLKIERKTGEC